MYDPIAASRAQADYCQDHGLPWFAPYDGLCYCCGRNIYKPVTWESTGTTTGITVESASSMLITGCPHCHRTYVD